MNKIKNRSNKVLIYNKLNHSKFGIRTNKYKYKNKKIIITKKVIVKNLYINKWRKKLKKRILK